MRKTILALNAWMGLVVAAVGQDVPDSQPPIELPLTSTRPAMMSASATQPQARVGLNDVCPVEWRGTPLRQALGELAERLGVRYILDASIPATVLDEPVRMSAVHLTGQQAFRWLARMGGISAVLVEDVFLVAPDDRLPAMWRMTGTGSPSQRASEEAKWARANAKRVDVNWVDAPLAGVAEDVRGLFGIDLLFHPLLLAEPKLVYLRETGINLDRFREVLGRQLNARTELFDGALWAYPEGETVEWLPATGRPAETMAAWPDESPMSPLDRWLGIDRSVTTWEALAEAISAAARVPCDIRSEAGAAYPGIEAAGSVAEVLEGLRMLGLVAWNIAPEGPSSGPRINIRVREKG